MMNTPEPEPRRDPRGDLYVWIHFWEWSYFERAYRCRVCDEVREKPTLFGCPGHSRPQP